MSTSKQGASGENEWDVTVFAAGPGWVPDPTVPLLNTSTRILTDADEENIVNGRWPGRPAEMRVEVEGELVGDRIAHPELIWLRMPRDTALGHDDELVARYERCGPRHPRPDLRRRRTV